MKLILTFCLLVAFYQVVFGYPYLQENGDGTVTAFVDSDDYDSLEDLWSPMNKRFWSPHPSDYNPLRRPPGGAGPPPRSSGSKRGEVYHPIPRQVTMKQRSVGQRLPAGDEFPEEFSDLMEGRQKKQTRPTTLIFRLGSWGLRGGRKQDKGATPSPA